MTSDLEERLERLERVLEDVLSRLDRVERMLHALGIDESMLTIASHLVLSFSTPAIEALEASRRVLEILDRFRIRDPISESIIEALSGCESLSISEVTRRVRLLRGRASRRIVRERLKTLETRGVVVNVGSRERPRYILSSCLE